MPFSAEQIKTWRGAVLRSLYTVDPEHVLESTLKRALHAQGGCPPESELLHVINWLRDKGFIKSHDLGRPGAPLFEHWLTADGIDIANGSTNHEGIW